MWRQGQSCDGKGLLLHRLCRSCVTGGAENTVIDPSSTAKGGTRSLRLMLNTTPPPTPRVDAFKSQRNQLLPSAASRASDIIQGGSERGVQRSGNYTCLLIVISISRRERLMSTKRRRAASGRASGGNTVGAGGFALVYPACTPGSRPCLFIVAGSELIPPISFRGRTRRVCLIYIFLRLHIFLYLLSFFSFALALFFPALACK